MYGELCKGGDPVAEKLKELLRKAVVFTGLLLIAVLVIPLVTVILLIYGIWKATDALALLIDRKGE